MVKYTKKDLRCILRRGLKEYEAAVGTVTPEERRELREWVAGGNSPYDNPCLLYDGDGRPMDYIGAARAGEDMLRNPENYYWGSSPELRNDIPHISF